jgi:hypothetical protein
MRTLPLLLACTVLMVCVCAAGQTSDSKNQKTNEALSPIVVSGLQAYKDKGPEEAVRAWIKGSGIDGSKEAMAQANTLRQVEDYYGKFQGFEVVKTSNLTPKTQVAYLVMDYEKGPVFAKFVSYRSEQGWVLAYFNFNTKEENLFPACY